MTHSAGEVSRTRESVWSSLQSLLMLTVVASFVVTFIVQPSRIPTGSMEPTLRVGDFVLIDKQVLAPGNRAPSPLWSGWTGTLVRRRGVERGDIIVFRYPVHPDVPMVKRVVAVAGDRVRLQAGKVYINGQIAAEPYATYTPSAPDAFRDQFPAMHHLSTDVDPGWWVSLRRAVVAGELQVPAGTCFVLGDNRNNSLDSRYWGFVPNEAIEGRPIAVLLSAARDYPGDTFGQRLQRVLRSERLVR